MASLAVCVKASSSASVDDVVTVACLDAFQLISPPKRVMTDPCDDFLVSLSSAKAASEAILTS